MVLNDFLGDMKIEEVVACRKVIFVHLSSLVKEPIYHARISGSIWIRSRYLPTRVIRVTSLSARVRLDAVFRIKKINSLLFISVEYLFRLGAAVAQAV
jgi:hypothetical protein